MNQINYMNFNQSSSKKTYTVKEIAKILSVSERTAYNLCNSTEDFKVLRIGKCVRIHKESFDNWFYND